MTMLASAIGYAPFGPLTGLAYGNGITETRSFDRASRLASITVPVRQGQPFGYDAVDSVTRNTDALRPEQGGHFAYDALSPLTRQVSAASDRVFAYDATSKRTRLEQTSAPSRRWRSR